MSDEKHAYIVRASEGDYFALRRKTAQDRTLSFEARGVLVYLLSRPIDWKVQPSDLEQCCGRDKVYSILRELIQHGYVRREDKPQDDKGKFRETVYYVYEDPQPCPEKPYTDQPYTDRPYTENTHITEMESVQNRDLAPQNASPASKVSHTEKKPKGAKPPAPPQLADEGIKNAIAKLCFGSQWQAAWNTQPASLMKVMKNLVASDPDLSLDKLRAFKEWYYKPPFEGAAKKQAPSVFALADYYLRFLAAQDEKVQQIASSAASEVEDPENPGVYVSVGTLRLRQLNAQEVQHG